MAIRMPASSGRMAPALPSSVRLRLIVYRDDAIELGFGASGLHAGAPVAQRRREGAGVLVVQGPEAIVIGTCRAPLQGRTAESEPNDSRRSRGWGVGGSVRLVAGAPSESPHLRAPRRCLPPIALGAFETAWPVLPSTRWPLD
jgi:hypothetical protein